MNNLDNIKQTQMTQYCSQIYSWECGWVIPFHWFFTDAFSRLLVGTKLIMWAFTHAQIDNKYWCSMSGSMIITKNKNYRVYYKIENLRRDSGRGIHVLSSEKIITKKFITNKIIITSFVTKLKILAGTPARFVFWKEYYKKKVITKK